MIQPDGMADDLNRVTMARVRILFLHPTIMPISAQTQRDNLTVPSQEYSWIRNSPPTCKNDVFYSLPNLDKLARRSVRYILFGYNSEEHSLYYIVDTSKSFDEASSDLEAAVNHHGFGVLHIHDLGTTLRSKGIEFIEQCRVFEVCNPIQAAKVLSTDMRLNMVLPCRISVFTENGQTRIGLIRPVEMLAPLSQDPGLVETAKEVENKMIQMVKDAV